MTSAGGISPFTGELLPVLIPAGTLFTRIHRISDGPIWFGPAPGAPPAYRFDAPARDYRTLYGAERLEGAFTETILRGGRKIIPPDQVLLRQWSIIELKRDLRLAKIFDNGLVAHGVTNDICAGNDYAPSQAFACSLFHAFPDLDGIAYRARHDNGEICHALFDRIDIAHLRIVESRHFINERAITDGLMRRYRASWDPNSPLPPP